MSSCLRFYLIFEKLATFVRRVITLRETQRGTLLYVERCADFYVQRSFLFDI